MDEPIKGLSSLTLAEKLKRVSEEVVLRVIAEKPFSDILLQIMNYGIGVMFMPTQDHVRNPLVNLKLRVWMDTGLEKVYYDQHIHPEVVGQVNL